MDKSDRSGNEWRKITNNDPGFARYYPYYLLKIHVNSQDPDLIEHYKKAVLKQQDIIKSARKWWHGLRRDEDTPVLFDAGFDIFVPSEEDVISEGTWSTTVNHKLHCAMYYMTWNKYHPSRDLDFCPDSAELFPTAFYLHPRSSLGTKTPYRLANSTGIIDAGYRGPLIGAFDVKTSSQDWRPEPYSRLLQICGPDLKYPIYPVLVDSLDDLGETQRGQGGFGSTGT